MRLPDFGLRSRLAALVLLGTVPACAVLMHGAIAARREALDRSRDELLRTALWASEDQRRVLESSAHLLRALAETDVVRKGSPEECSRFLAGFLRQEPLYANLGIAREDGTIRASALPVPPGASTLDRSWFREALRADGFVVGERQVGRMIGRASLNAALQFGATDGGREVIFVALDLARLQERAAGLALPEGAHLELFDAKGSLLVRTPALASHEGGIAPPAPPMNAAAPGTAEALDASGRAWLHGFVPILTDAGSTAALLRVGLPRDAVVGPADRALYRNLAMMGVLSALALGAAFFLGRMLVVRRVERLEEAAGSMAESLESERAARSAVAGDLRSREQIFGEMAESMEEVFWVSAPGVRSIHYASPAFERVWGVPPGTLYERPALWAESIHPSDRERVLAAAARDEEGGRFDESYRILRPDGSARWIRDKAFPVRDASGAVVRIFGIAKDITRFRDLEHQVQQSQKMEAVGRLAAGVAHDFNNMLTVIQGYAQLAREGKAGDREGHLDQVLQASAQATALTRQLLTFSRRQPVSPKALDLNAVLSDMDRMIRRLIGAPVEVVTLPGRDLPAVHADPNQIQQVVVNLVVNARDAMPQGGRLTLETYGVVVDESYARGHMQTKPGPYVVLAVTDTGIGMDDSVKDRIFEPFFTTKPEGKGTGLGLATVYGIVQQCGGDIFVYSEKGVGTTFKVYLPPLARKGPVPTAAAPAPAARSSSKTVLLVEDEQQIRALVFAVLHGEGHAVITAASAEEALRELAGHPGPVDLLLSDLGLPGMDGLALAEKVRAARPAIRVVLMSGYTESTAVGGDGIPPWAGYLAKPFGPPVLLAKLAEVFGPPAAALAPWPPPEPVVPCLHPRLQRMGIQEAPHGSRRLFLLLCMDCGTTISTARLRESRTESDTHLFSKSPDSPP